MTSQSTTIDNHARSEAACSALATFLYHEVTDNVKDSGFQRPSALAYKHSRDAFTKHLDQIAASQMTPELITAIKLTRPGRHLLLTFDDGGRSATYISDELSKRGWRGHFFITTGRIGSATFLDSTGIQYLYNCGHSVGSHSHTHPNIFRSLSYKQMLEEWQTSSDILAQLLGKPCTVASVPGGDISELVLQSAGASGIKHLFTSEPSLTAHRVQDCWVLGRFCPKRDTPPALVGKLARFEGWTKRLLIRRCNVLTRRLLFPVYKLYATRSSTEYD